MSETPTAAAPPATHAALSARTAAPQKKTTPPHFFADLYTFDWSALSYRLPAVSAAAVAVSIATGLALGHPGAGLIAGGGALTIGFGANQRIADSRLWPMILAILSMAVATLIGTLAGHRSYGLIVASACAAAIYGVLTMRNSGLAWVGQQAAIALFVASAFPQGPRGAFERAGLIVAGGTVQLIFTSVGLRLMPELKKDLLTIPRSLYASLYAERRELLMRLRDLPASLPAPDRKAALIYALRLVITVTLASWLYVDLKMQSGYWVPMTALLVEKPAFFETLSRGMARTFGTIFGATLASVLAMHLPGNLWLLGGLAVFFAFWCFATISVNYGLYSLAITSYIVFLLSLNQIPGPEIAARRAWCTAAGAALALVVHLDALRRHRQIKTGQNG